MAEKARERAVVLSQEEIAPGIYDLRLRAEKIAAAARAGQFVSLYCADESRLLPRPISICEVLGVPEVEERGVCCGGSAEGGEPSKQGEKNGIRLVYRIAGAGTREFSTLQKGDGVDVLGPLGNGFPLRDETAFLVGGGIGIPPMLQLAQELSCEKQIILGYRDSQLFLADDLREYGAVYIATEDGSAGTKGTVLDAIRANGLSADVIYACGPAPMLRALKQYAAEQHIPCWVSMEERMACGIGACLACVCRSREVDAHTNVHNKRICREGPVFLADEIEF